MGRTILEMENISKSFGATQALSGIGFSLEEGEIHALLGENGAGKSTLIKILGGIYQPDTGMIRIDGKEVKMAGVQEAQETGIGIIHQEIVLVPYLSVSENIFSGTRTENKTRNKRYESDEPAGKRNDGKTRTLCGCNDAGGKA